MRSIFYCFLNIWSPVARYLYRDRLRVLAYHGVENKQAFEKQLAYLKKNYTLISISQLDSFFKSPQANKIPKNSLLITFDDGNYNIIDNGLPALIKNSIPACIFVVTETINSKKEFWWDTVERNLLEKGKSMGQIRDFKKYLKELSNIERLNIIEEMIPIEKKQYSTADLRNFEKHNIIIGNHSHTHPMLDKCENEEIASEINNSKSCFNNWEVGTFEYFAYPNGNWDKNSESFLKKNDIRLAFLFDHKINPLEISPLRISRIKVNADMSIPELKVKTSGLHSLILNLK